MRTFSILGLLALIIACCIAIDAHNTPEDPINNELLPIVVRFDDQENPPPVTAVSKWNKYTLVATVTAVVVVIVGAISVAALFSPAVAFKLCSMMGGCDYSLNTYIDQYLNDTNDPRTWRSKRSVEEFGPILSGLVEAYRAYDTEKTVEKRWADVVGPLLQTVAENYGDDGKKKNLDRTTRSGGSQY